MADVHLPEPAPEPRWPAILAVVVVGALYAALPPSLNAGPRWLLLLIVSALGLLYMILNYRYHRGATHLKPYVVGHALSVVVTLSLVWCIILLVRALPSKQVPADDLLHSAGILWVTNVLVFASWYWRLDAGGPQMRDRRAEHTVGAFLFPQMTLPREHPAHHGNHRPHRRGRQSWSPEFIDYLFLAFNTSTALSPTDAPVLSRWAKVLVMLQAMISLSIIALLAARAVNIL